jgi:allantoinase
MPPKKGAAAAAARARGAAPTPTPPTTPPTTPPLASSTTTTSTARTLLLLLVNVLAAATLYSRVNSGDIPVPEPVARFVGDVTVGLGLAEALPGLAAASSAFSSPSSSSSSSPPCGLLGHPSFIVTSSRVVFPDGVRPGALLIRHGKIAASAPSAEDLQPRIVRLLAPMLLQPLPLSSFPLSYFFQPYPILDYGYSAVSPGVIDVHAHLNEPGREEWEGIATGTAAAATGGVTTVIDMPLNSAPAAVTADLLVAKAQAVRKAGPRVDVALWGGLVPANAADSVELARMLSEGGALGFKSFMCPSGIRDFDHVSVGHVRAALPVLKRLGVPYLVHAELVEPPPLLLGADGESGAAARAPAAPAARTGADAPVEPPSDPSDRRRRKYATYLATRPASFERDAIAQLVTALADVEEEEDPPGGAGKGGGGAKQGGAAAAWRRNNNFRLHVVHLGDASSVPLLAAAKRRLPNLSVETCPHYLLFDAAHVRDGDTRFKCAPPLRSAENRRQLAEAVASGVVDLVASDHSPAPASLKAQDTGDFIAAWGGINGLQYLLPATWTALRGSGSGSSGRSSTSALLTSAARLLSSAPAALAGLAGRKGALIPGLDADLVVWDPEAPADTTAAANRHKHGADTSPYVSSGGGGGEGALSLRGRVLATFVRGSLVFEKGQVAEAPASGTCGQLLLRPGAKVRG